MSKKTFLVGLALALVLALATRLVAVAQYESAHPDADRPVIDEGSYDRWAREIADGDWVGRGVFFQEPLYPYSLAVIYRIAGGGPTQQRHAARLVHVALGLATVALGAWLALRLAGVAGGLVAAFALALYRPLIWFPLLLLKENLFLPIAALFAIAFIAAIERLGASREDAPTPRAPRAWLAVGFLVGVGALLRGNMLVLAPLCSAWPIVRARFTRTSSRTAWLCAGACVLGVALALAPVALRNRVVGGSFVLTTAGAGTNFYGGNNLENPYGKAMEFSWVRAIPEHEADDWRHEAERRTGRTLDAAQTSSFWLGEALRSMRERPLFHLHAFWNKLRATLGTYEVPDNHFIEWDARYVAILRAPWPGFAWWGSLGLAGLLVALARRRAFATAAAFDLALFVAAYVATIVLTVTSERVRLVLVPWLTAFAAGWLVHVVRARRDARVWISALVALAASIALVCTPLFDERALANDLDERDYNLAADLVRAGDLSGAEKLSGDLVHRHPDTPRVVLLVAELDYRRARAVLDRAAPSPEDRDRAQKVVVDVLLRLDRIEKAASEQELFRLRALRGAIFQWLGDWASAERDFRAAAAFDPGDRDVARRLALSIANHAMLADFSGDRAAALADAERRLAELAQDSSDAALVKLLDDVRAARAALQR